MNRREFLFNVYKVGGLAALIALGISRDDATALTLSGGTLKGGTIGRHVVLNNLTAGLSMLNGVAFATNPKVNGVNFNLGNYPDWTLTLLASGQSASGIIKQAGTGETLGNELCLDPGFDDASKWTSVAHWTIASSVLEADGSQSTGEYTSTAIVPASILLKVGYDVKTATSGTVRARLSSVFSGIARGTVGNGYTEYISNSNSDHQVGFDSTGSFIGTLDNFTAKKVLTPSSTGVVIWNGSAQNWVTVGGTFNPNTTYTAILNPPGF
jgi:hypothetical protein